MVHRARVLPTVSFVSEIFAVDRYSPYRRSLSMSACIRSLYSSDQWALGFPLALLCACGRGGVLLSLADFRAATFSLSVTRDDVGLEDEFDLFMQFIRHLFPFVKNCS
jgi:hypothetical protein